MAQKLTDKEELYCQKYVILLNKTKAATEAGYSKRSAKEIGYENFTKPHIQSRIAEIRQEIKEQLGIDEHSVLAELASLSYWSIKDFLNANNSVKDLSKMDIEKLKPVMGIKVKQSTTKIKGIVTKEVTVDLKMADKRGSLEQLGRHLGIYERDNKQKGTKIKVTRK